MDANYVFVDDNVEDSEIIFLFTYLLNLIQNMYMLYVRWFKLSIYLPQSIPVDYVTVGTDIAIH